MTVGGTTGAFRERPKTGRSPGQMDACCVSSSASQSLRAGETGKKKRTKNLISDCKERKGAVPPSSLFHTGVSGSGGDYIRAVGRYKEACLIQCRQRKVRGGGHTDVGRRKVIYATRNVIILATHETTQLEKSTKTLIGLIEFHTSRFAS